MLVTEPKTRPKNWQRIQRTHVQEPTCALEPPFLATAIPVPTLSTLPRVRDVLIPHRVQHRVQHPVQHRVQHQVQHPAQHPVQHPVNVPVVDSIRGVIMHQPPRPAHEPMSATAPTFLAIATHVLLPENPAQDADLHHLHQHPFPVPGVRTLPIVNPTKLVAYALVILVMKRSANLVASAIKRGTLPHTQNNHTAAVVHMVLKHGVQKLELHPC